MELASLENDPKIQRLVDKFSDINFSIKRDNNQTVLAGSSDQSVDIEENESK